MPGLTRPQKITLAEMRAAGVRGLLIFTPTLKQLVNSVDALLSGQAHKTSRCRATDQTLG
jgi:hypothetical protein